LKLDVLSKFAFKFNLRRYTLECTTDVVYETVTPLWDETFAVGTLGVPVLATSSASTI